VKFSKFNNLKIFLTKKIFLVKLKITKKKIFTDRQTNGQPQTIVRNLTKPHKKTIEKKILLKKKNAELNVFGK